MKGDAQFAQKRLQPGIHFLHGHSTLASFCFGKTTGVPYGQRFGEVVATPEHGSKEDRAAMLNQTQGGFRRTDVEDRQIGGNMRAFLLEKLGNRVERHAVDTDGGWFQFGSSQELEMLGNFVLRRRRDQHLCAFR